MKNYKLQCNVRSNTWAVMLDGVEVYTATTATEAVKWIKERKVDLFCR